MSPEKIKRLTMNGLQTTNRSGQRRLLRNASPGHLELWFFGWTSDKYRSYFPLYPLPAVVFTPYLIHLVETYASDVCNPYPLTIDLRPQLEYTIISQKTKHNQFAYQIPFIDNELLNQCQQEALNALPACTDASLYQEKISIALKAACEEYDTAHASPTYPPAKKSRRKGSRRRKHKQARALPSHYKFLEPLS